MKKGPYRVHRARVMLAMYGVTVTAVADRVGITPSSVSRQLSGEARVSDAVRDALTDLAGADAAAEVMAAIPRPIEQAAA